MPPPCSAYAPNPGALSLFVVAVQVNFCWCVFVVAPTVVWLFAPMPRCFGVPLLALGLALWLGVAHFIVAWGYAHRVDVLCLPPFRDRGDCELFG